MQYLYLECVIQTFLKRQFCMFGLISNTACFEDSKEFSIIIFHVYDLNISSLHINMFYLNIFCHLRLLDYLSQGSGKTSAAVIEPVQPLTIHIPELQ